MYSLRELRARFGLSQNDMAKRLGISRATYNYWENHMDSLTLGKLKRIALALGVELRDIFLPV